MVNVRSYIIGLSLSMLWGTTIGAPVTEPQGNIDAPDTLLEEFELEFDSTLNSQEIEELKKQVKEFYSGKGEVFNGTVDLSLEKRATGAQNDPKPITVNVAAWQNIAEMNCYVILCNYNGNLVWYVPTLSYKTFIPRFLSTNNQPLTPWGGKAKKPNSSHSSDPPLRRRHQPAPLSTGPARNARDPANHDRHHQRGGVPMGEH